MNTTPDHARGSIVSRVRSRGIEGRIFRTMLFATVFSVIGSVPFGQWRITAGLLVGGLLSLLNHQWLSNSTAAAFSVLYDDTSSGAKPRIKLAQYILRYVVVTAIVFAGYKLGAVSLTWTLVGLCTFVVALFVEAFREFYFAIIRREEIS